MPRIEDRRERFKAGVLYGQGQEDPSPRRFGQLSDEAVERIKQLVKESFEEALPPAMEAAAEKIEERYSTTSYLVVGSLVVTAIATTVLAGLAIYKAATK